MTITWKSVREQILSNPEVKKYYDELTPEFEKAKKKILKKAKKNK